MASYMDLNSGSSDSEGDEDYVPPNSESEGSEIQYCGDEDPWTCCGNDSDYKEPVQKRPKHNQDDSKLPPATNKAAIWEKFLESAKSSPYNKNDRPKVEAPASVPENVAKKDADELCKPSALESFQRSCNWFPKTVDNKVPDETPMIDKALSQKVDVKATIEPPDKSKFDKKKDPVDVFIRKPSAGVLAPFLGSIAGKARKPSVLDKTLADWKQFKDDEGITNELETFNKGREGYIERKRFLERSDIRTFENEKNVREASRKRK